MQALKLYNSRTRSIEPFNPLNNDCVSVYSCGPTVYDTVHIGNLSAFIAADTLRRVLEQNDYNVKHVMNFTDVDDKTITRSALKYPDMNPRDALKSLTDEYSKAFLNDMQSIGCDIASMLFVRATDDKTISDMKELVKSLIEKEYAYIAEDGVYFSIDAYKNSGKTYGQLSEITTSEHSSARIQNDEYDKEQAHDFALWKKQKPGEPTWELTIDGQNLSGRPGWHLECSVMSVQNLGLPFDIHTGGIDLKFPHHENEIAQSTAGQDDSLYAKTFVHNEHILIDGQKMSKSKQNFFTLNDLRQKQIDPLAFRMLVLQSHYRKQTNFSFDNISAAANRLNHWRDIASLRWQTHDTVTRDEHKDRSLLVAPSALVDSINDDIDTPKALGYIDTVFNAIDTTPLSEIHHSDLVSMLEKIDALLGLELLSSTPDIDDDAKRLIIERTRARDKKDWQRSDEIRDELLRQRIVVRDSPQGSIWKWDYSNI